MTNQVSPAELARVADIHRWLDQMAAVFPWIKPQTMRDLSGNCHTFTPEEIAGWPAMKAAMVGHLGRVATAGYARITNIGEVSSGSFIGTFLDGWGDTVARGLYMTREMLEPVKPKDFEIGSNGEMVIAYDPASIQRTIVERINAQQCVTTIGTWTITPMTVSADRYTGHDIAADADRDETRPVTEHYQRCAACSAEAHIVNSDYLYETSGGAEVPLCGKCWDLDDYVIDDKLVAAQTFALPQNVRARRVAMLRAEMDRPYEGNRYLDTFPSFGRNPR